MLYTHFKVQTRDNINRQTDRELHTYISDIRYSYLSAYLAYTSSIPPPPAARRCCLVLSHPRITHHAPTPTFPDPTNQRTLAQSKPAHCTALTTPPPRYTLQHTKVHYSTYRVHHLRYNHPVQSTPSTRPPTRQLPTAPELSSLKRFLQFSPGRARCRSGTRQSILVCQLVSLPAYHLHSTIQHLGILLRLLPARRILPTWALPDTRAPVPALDLGSLGAHALASHHRIASQIASQIASHRIPSHPSPSVTIHRHPSSRLSPRMIDSIRRIAPRKTPHGSASRPLTSRRISTVPTRPAVIGAVAAAFYP